MKATTFLFFIVATCIGANVLYAQSSFIPQNLGLSVNSTYDDINPLLSPDGKTLYFVRVNHPENTFGEEDSEDIWYTELQPDGAWSQAQRIMPLNIGRYNAIMSLSSDGNTALLNGVYNKKGNIWKKRGLSTSTRTESGWSTPQKLKVSKLSKRNRGLKSSGTMSADGKYLILSFSRSYNSKKTNLFVSEKKENGEWRKPKPIKALNSNASEDTPFLLADNKTMYFSSNYETGHYDIYRVTRMGDDWKRNWSAPVHLSDTVNSTGWEAYLKTNTTGSWAYFSSTNKSTGGADIFKVKLFEENPFVIVSGTIKHSINNRPLIGKAFTIFVDGKEADSLFVNSDSATYKVKLPLGKSYTMTAHTNHYKPLPEIIDITNVREFSNINKDLKARPLPFVRLTGRLLVANTGQTIPPNANARIFINGIRNDSAVIDKSNSTYTLNIDHGVVYKLQVKGNRFESTPQTLDLSKVDEYREIPFDLYAEEEHMALVTGKIIDKKTNKPIAAKIPMAVKVEGISSVYATIDTLTSIYELKLPLGKSYTISASAANYYPLYETIDVTFERGNVKIFKDLVIVPIEVGQSIRLNNIFFESAKAALKTESFPELDRVSEFLTNNPDIKIEIAGHTDNVGKADMNQKLSQARAKSVADYIISKGISRERIVAKGYGLSKPVASNATKVGKAQNRRVEFTILDK